MRTILIVLSLFIAQTIIAQRDTVIFNLSDYGKIMIIKDDVFLEKNPESDFDKAFADFYTDFQKVNKSELRDSSFSIRYYTEKMGATRNLKVEQKKDKESSFYFKDSVVHICKDFNIKASIEIVKLNEKKIDLQIFVNNISDFEKIKKISIDSLYKKAKTDLPISDMRNSASYKIIYDLNNNFENKMNPWYLKLNNQHDYISLYPSFGLSIINTNFSPEIDINLTMFLHGNNNLKYRFGLNHRFLFIPDENNFFKTSTYNIVNAFYDIYIKENSSHQISLGYMYRKTGAHFNSNTWLTSWQYNYKQMGFRISGYITKNTLGDYTIIPSIGINFGF